MKRNKIRYDRWLRTLFLSFALLTGGGGWMVWGQTDNTYTDPDNSKTITLISSANHETIKSVETKTIYVKLNKNGEKNWRELFIPELRISQPSGSVDVKQTKGDLSMNWYVHWYVKGKGEIKHKQVTITRSEAQARGGDIPQDTYTTKNRFWKVLNENGLVWSNRLKNTTSEQGCGMDVSTIGFSLDAQDYQEDGTKIYCDVSIYKDGEINNNIYNEPTLFKRYIYEIKRAEDSPTQIPVEQEIDFPKGGTSINFMMPHAPDNYFWGENNEIQGTTFMYSIGNENGEYKDFCLVAKDQPLFLQRTQKIDLSKYEEGVTVYVKVRDGNYQKKNVNDNIIENVIAKYTFHPVEHSEFLLEEESKEYEQEQDFIRWPRNYSDKYEEIGSVDFDQGNRITHQHFLEQKNKNNKDNMSPNPVGHYLTKSRTTYGFIAKGSDALQKEKDKCFTTMVNAYGLFRSANVSGISGDGDLCSETDFEGTRRIYKWIPTYIAKAHQYENVSLSDKTQDTYANRVLYDRTYEITKNDPVENNKKHGYFYYVDATDEPGTLVEVPITGTLCGNTELKVTAWVSDMTRACLSNGQKPLPPNIDLIFKGTDQEKNEEIILHWFTSGDAKTDYTVDISNSKCQAGPINRNLMLWQQLCYTFIIPQDKLDKCDPNSFRLEVQNNEPHTDGADYAIDDIRIFKTKPNVTLKQVIDPCSEITEYVPFVKFETDYEMLLTNMGLNRNQATRIKNVNPDQYDETKDPDEKQVMDQLKKYIAQKKEEGKNVDLTKFTKIAYMIYDTNDLTKPLKIKYDGKNETYYRVSYLSTNQEDMEWTGNYNYDPKNPLSTITSTTINIGGLLKTETNYIVRVYGKDVDELKQIDPEKDTSSTYNISDNGDLCAMKKVFGLPPVKGLLEIKSGETTVKPAEMEQNGTYELTAHLTVLNANGDPDEDATPENPVFYWFFGTESEFHAKTLTLEDNSTISVYEAFTGLDVNADQTMVLRIKNALQSKYGLIDNVSDESITFSSDKRIILGADKVTLKMENAGQPLMIYTPSNQNQLSTLDKNRYCSKPHYFELGNVPTIDPGDPNVPDPEDPEDPKDPEDPDPKDPNNPNQPDDFGGKHVRSVRVGLVQIQDMYANSGTLRIPIHSRESAENEKFVKNESNTDITVLKTSDTEWDKSKSVATLENLADDAPNAAWTTNYFTIKFTEDAAKNFKEGFWYMVDIPYAVKDNNGNGTVVYTSSMKLTLKIVPEYVTWVGSAENMHNWNNDGPSHWRRSNNTELYITDNKYAEANGNHTEAYTPMRFTKVTVAGNKDGKAYSAYPYLYELKKNTGSQKKDPKNVLLNMDVPTNLTTENIGAATKNIEYDLLADPDYEQELFGNVNNPDKTQGHSYACVRFYGNACDEIYIKPESEILHTEYLTYNKAHVDYEMDPNRWYMLASPLKGVVSGDMYLPTGTETPKVGNYARQETPAFDNINYNTTDYTRWKPAVYMRGWDKTTATVVRSDDTKPSYGIQGSWSNLYNDVDVPFTPGTGFSIGTKTDKATTLTNGKVLFRLPKADGEYTYYGNGETTGGNITTIKEDNRAGNGRFHISPDEKGQNVVESCSASSTGGMFGNPFMSHLDMEKFFEKNNSSENVYYIMGKSATKTVLFGDNYTLSTGTDDNGQYVAPLQSFIVKDLASATFNTDMIAKAPANGTNVGLRSATVAPAEEPLPQLRITATRNGVRNTAVVAGLATASDSYVEGEDAALLINEEVAAPQVYTLAGNQMVAINVTPDLAEIPVGIHGKDATPVELSFKLSGAMKNVKLVDKQTGKRYDVTDGLTLTVPGNTYGRYFLNGSIATSNEIIARNHIIFYNSAPGRIDVSSVDALSEVTVYDIAGRALRTLRNLNTPTASVDHLAPGIYVVRAESGSQTISEKVEVK